MGAASWFRSQSGFAQDLPRAMERLIRFCAAASLIALLAACGGERDRDREEGPADREKPSLGAPQDDDGAEDKTDKKESRGDEEDDD